MRVEKYLPNLIHTDQTGFVKGRYIGQNIRLLSDVMDYVDYKKLPGILLFVDFEKAFDTLEWNFITKINSEIGSPFFTMAPKAQF